MNSNAEACKNKGQSRDDGTVSEFVKSWITRLHECIPSCWDAAVCEPSMPMKKLDLGRYGPNKLRLSQQRASSLPGCSFERCEELIGCTFKQICNGQCRGRS